MTNIVIAIFDNQQFLFAKRNDIAIFRNTVCNYSFDLIVVFCVNNIDKIPNNHI